MSGSNARAAYDALGPGPSHDLRSGKWTPRWRWDERETLADIDAMVRSGERYRSYRWWARGGTGEAASLEDAMRAAEAVVARRAT